MLCVQLAVIVTFWQFGGVIFNGPQNDPERADLIAVLGGPTVADRLRRGAELYREGWGNRVMVSGFSESEPSPDDWRLRLLTRQGVPLTAITTDASASSSLEEARMILRTLRAQAWTKVLVVSDPPHLRRLSLVYRKVFGADGTGYRLIASNPPWWDPDEWWRNPDAAAFLVEETIKLIYYKFAYGL